MDLLAQAFTASREGIGYSTHQKQDGAWRKWCSFLKQSQLGNCFLEGKTKQERVGIVAAFAVALRHNHFGKTSLPSLRGDTVRAAIDQVGKTFRTHGHTDPSHDAIGQRHLMISRLLQGYVDKDPPQTRQPALPLAVFRKLHTQSNSDLDKAVANLACGALFFGLR